MPPKPKNTREEVATAAYEIIKAEGIDALSARQLGKKLNCSAGSLFTLFASMEEVKMAARDLALEEFKEYIGDYRQYTPPFKRIGMMIVMCAIKKPELFKLLFMQEHEEAREFEDSIGDLGDIYDTCIELVMNGYSMTHDEAKFMFEQLWTQAYGLGTMCAMGVCKMTEDEIGARLGCTFMSNFMFIKSGKLEEVNTTPHKELEGVRGSSEYSELFEKMFGDQVGK